MGNTVIVIPLLKAGDEGSFLLVLRPGPHKPAGFQSKSRPLKMIESYLFLFLTLVQSS